MKRGDIPDPQEIVIDGHGKPISLPRSSLYRIGDVFGNNAVPYEWEAIGMPRTWFGQNIRYWMPMPYPSEEQIKRVSPKGQRGIETPPINTEFVANMIIGALALGYVGNDKLLKDDESEEEK